MSTYQKNLLGRKMFKTALYPIRRIMKKYL
nr:MAG TPA: hypothetical protein [Caudoviricetes sp.]